MPWTDRTSREVEGRLIDGTWRHVFINNGGTYYLTALKVYADGQIDCWGLVDLDGFREKLRTGWVATDLPQGGQASANLLATWRFDAPEMRTTAADLLAEVADEIEELAGRPTSTDRCLAALDRYRTSRQEADREALAAAYLAIPTTHRAYALGDMDARDQPVRVVATPVGERLVGARDGDPLAPVTEETRERAFTYLSRRDADRVVRHPADGPDDGGDPGSVVVPQAVYPDGWPADPGILVLRNEHPSAVDVSGERYPSVAHAYWSLAMAGRADHDRVRAEANPAKARRLARDLPARAGWSATRLSVMSALVRAKVDQHPEAARQLDLTGERAILYQDDDSFWGSGRTGRGWMGRLLEVVRADRAATG